MKICIGLDQKDTTKNRRPITDLASDMKRLHSQNLAKIHLRQLPFQR